MFNKSRRYNNNALQQNSGYVPITGFEPADPQLLATASTTYPAVPYQK